MTALLAQLMLVTALALSACTGGGSGDSKAGAKTSGGASGGTAGQATSGGDGGTGSQPPKPEGIDVKAENAQPGTAAWKTGVDAGEDHGIEGYADRVEVATGESFKLFVSTTAPQFTATAYRIGFYGGANGRQVWKSDQTAGKVQAAATVKPGVNTVTTTWQPSLTVATKDWPEGDYLVRLDAVGGAVKGARYVPITVKSASTAGKVVLINAVTTWQAYNEYGGYDLYNGPAPAKSYGARARAVSFDRPYDTTGADRFQTYEQSSIIFSEKLASDKGLRLAYATDVDLHENPALFKDAAAIITLGHDEYWSTQMRATTTKARDAGTNVAFLGANAVFRHIRFADTALGKDRVVIDYKDAAEDPTHVANPSEATQDWRDAPNPRPENVLTGVLYECNPSNADLVVYDPASWLFAGTGVAAGQHIKGLVGVEYDRIVADPTTPHPIQAISHSPITCRNKKTYADAAYYTVPSGAGVFSTGTMRWNCALYNGGCSDKLDAGSYRFAQATTANLLLAFAAGPAGKAHPAVDNTAALKPAPSWGGDAP